MDDPFTFKSLIATLSAPFVFIFGLIGWHYKTVVSDVKELKTAHENLQMLVSQHSIHVKHLQDCIQTLDSKIDILLERSCGKQSRTKN